MTDATWQCYCRADPIPLGQDCPSCGWDGRDDARAAEIGWARAEDAKRGWEGALDVLDKVRDDRAQAEVLVGRLRCERAELKKVLRSLDHTLRADLVPAARRCIFARSDIRAALAADESEGT